MEYFEFSNFITTAIISGIIGTSGMTFLLFAVTKSGKANADMVRALGSLFTKKLDNAFGTGILIHFISGILFALVYTFLITFFDVNGFLSTTGAGVLIGFIHGAVVSFLLVATVAENHPLPEFQEAGFSVAAAHWIAHIVYGLVVGITIGLMNTGT